MPTVTLPAPWASGVYDLAGLRFVNGTYSSSTALTARQASTVAYYGATVDGVVVPVPRAQVPATLADLDAKAASDTATYLTLALQADGIAYNSDGSVATSTLGGITTTYTYDSNGNVATEARLGKTKTWTYDGAGNPTGSVVA